MWAWNCAEQARGAEHNRRRREKGPGGEGGGAKQRSVGSLTGIPFVYFLDSATKRVGRVAEKGDSFLLPENNNDIFFTTRGEERRSLQAVMLGRFSTTFLLRKKDWNWKAKGVVMAREKRRRYLQFPLIGFFSISAEWKMGIQKKKKGVQKGGRYPELLWILEGFCGVVVVVVFGECWLFGLCHLLSSTSLKVSTESWILFDRKSSSTDILFLPERKCFFSSKDSGLLSFRFPDHDQLYIIWCAIW